MPRVGSRTFFVLFDDLLAVCGPDLRPPPLPPPVQFHPLSSSELSSVSFSSFPPPDVPPAVPVDVVVVLAPFAFPAVFCLGNLVTGISTGFDLVSVVGNFSGSFFLGSFGGEVSLSFFGGSVARNFSGSFFLGFAGWTIAGSFEFVFGKGFGGCSLGPDGFGTVFGGCSLGPDGFGNGFGGLGFGGGLLILLFFLGIAFAFFGSCATGDDTGVITAFIDIFSVLEFDDEFEF